MNDTKAISLQCLIFFCAMTLLPVSVSFAEDDIILKGSSLKESTLKETTLKESTLKETTLKEEKTTSEQASQPIISSEQLTQCLEKIELANQTANKLDEQAGELEHLKNNLDELKQELESKRMHLDLHSEVSVNEFNQMKKRLTLLTQNYSSEAENYNHSVEQHKADNEALKAECGDKRYFENKTTPVLSQ